MIEKTIKSYSKEDTFSLGYEIGQKVKTGDLIALDGELGAGKTLLTQGIGKGMGIKEHITSPSFALLNIYTEGKIPLFHFDAYRLSSYEEILDIGYEEYNQGQGVIVIEWASNIGDLPTDNIIRIRIEKDLNISKDYRLITIKGWEGK